MSNQDKISNPLGEIEKLFLRRLKSSNGHVNVNEFGEHSVYEKLLEDPDFVKDIPYLNARSLGRIQHNSLVRYRGIVQMCMMRNTLLKNVQKQQTGESRLMLSKHRDTVAAVRELPFPTSIVPIV